MVVGHTVASALAEPADLTDDAVISLAGTTAIRDSVTLLVPGFKATNPPINVQLPPAVLAGMTVTIDANVRRDGVDELWELLGGGPLKYGEIAGRLTPAQPRLLKRMCVSGLLQVAPAAA